MIPIRTSISPRKTPYANYLLIAINVAIFAVSYRPHEVWFLGQRVLEPLRLWAQQFMLTPERHYLHLWQFVTYAFLHGSIMHILGNMYFLFVFGNNVNDKLGNVGYICLYLAGAVFSGIGHSLLHTNAVLGASGAVAAVTGAYLVLFPQTVITVLYFFIFIGTIEIKAIYFIAFKLIFWDNIFEPRFSPDAVAYDAHLAGYAFGVVGVLFLLSFKLIDGHYADLWSMLRQWNRRRRYRDVVADEYDSYGAGRVSRPVNAQVRPNEPQIPSNEHIAELRAQISKSLTEHNAEIAVRDYLLLLKEDAEQVLPRQNQLDIANQLMSTGGWADAARAYEKFIKHYSSYEYAEQVQLMLGLLYTRYLKEPQKARENLTAAREKLTQQGQIQMCGELLGELEGL